MGYFFIMGVPPTPPICPTLPFLFYGGVPPTPPFLFYGGVPPHPLFYFIFSDTLGLRYSGGVGGTPRGCGGATPI